MLIFIVIILLASLGNLLVIISVIRTKNLRRQKAYYFVVSLAVAGGSSVISLHIYNLNWTDDVSCSDLSVSMGAMVFNAINVVLDGHWMFSVWLCDMYNAMDVVFSTASILNLVCISMYRWEKYFTNVSPKYFIHLRWCQIVAFPASYQEYFGRQVVFSLIVGIWVVSFIIAFVPIFTNIYTTQQFLHTRDPCKCEFIVNEW